MTKKKKNVNKNPFFHRQYQDAKNQYYNAIKLAKTSYWNDFLTKEDPSSIFKAISYTKDVLVQPIPGITNISTNTLKIDFQDKCNAFRAALFLNPPTAPDVDLLGYTSNPDWDWPALEPSELRNACTTKLKGTTPGPDLITQEIITHAYNTIPDVFYSIYSVLLNTGYHPRPWKQATGIILKKQGKPDYSAPKAYRVILLLNCLGKVSE